ncbi:MAG: hypothetical protein AAGJ40_18085 [Planctomycetota bacterium]
MIRPALTLMEMILAIAITSMFAAAALTFVRGDGDAAHATACQATRTSLLNDVAIYEAEQGGTADAQFDRLIQAGIISDSFRQCPSTGVGLRWTQGRVVCPVHGSD